MSKNYHARVRQTLLIWCLFVSSQLPSHALSDGPTLSRFRYSNRKIVLQAVASDGKTLALVLDTAAQVSFLLPKSVSNSGWRKPAHKVSKKTHDSEILILPQLSIGAAKLRNVTFYVQPLPRLDSLNKQFPSEHIDGILGIDALHGQAVGLDLLHETLIFWQGGHLNRAQIAEFNSLCLAGDATISVAPGSSQTPGGLGVINPAFRSAHPFPIPLHRSRKTGFYSVSARLDSQQMELFVDTGSDALSLPSSMAAKITPVLELEDGQAADLNTIEPVKVMSARKLSLGGYDEEYPRVISRIKPSTGASEGLLGLADFANCRLVLDFPARKLYVSKYRDRREEYGTALHTLGIFFSESGDQLVAHVVRGSVAEQAGLSNGDTITAINSFALDQPLPTGKTDPYLVKSGTEFTMTASRSLPFNAGHVVFPVRLGTFYGRAEFEGLGPTRKQVIPFSDQGFLVINNK